MADSLASATVTVPAGTDVHDFMDGRGWSDGLPLVPPTAARVRRMLAGCSRLGSERLPPVPPCGGALTVEGVAISAVMAGCRPRQFPVALAAVEAMLDPAFNLHGVSATTMGATPVVVVSGPARHAAGLNCGLGALGSGSRNAAIGRTLKLVLQNVGGAVLGGTESTTLGSPSKFGLCCAENEELLMPPAGGEAGWEGGWEPLHTMRASGGHAPGDSAVLVAACVSGPHQVVDVEMRLAGSAEDNAAGLCEMLATSLATAWSAAAPMINDVLLVVSPEHYKTLRMGGIDSKAQLQQRLWSLCNGHMAPHLRTIVASMKGGGAAWHVAGGALGLVARAANVLTGGGGLAIVPKFERPESLHIIVAGGGAGKFSAFLPCFGLTKDGPMAHLSRPVSRRVEGTVGEAQLAAAVVTEQAAPGGAVRLLDPSPAPIAPFELAPRAATAAPSLLGTVGMLSISKRGSDALLDRLAALLAERFPGAAVKRYAKETFSRCADEKLLAQIAAECKHVVAALADCGSCTTCIIHDVASCERRGLPSVALLTDEFVAQASYQAGKLGLAKAARVLVQHPVVDPECPLPAKAEAVFEDVVRALTSDDVPVPQPPGDAATAAEATAAECSTCD